VLGNSLLFPSDMIVDIHHRRLCSGLLDMHPIGLVCASLMHTLSAGYRTSIC
jgi:hypothetical protein